MTGAMRQISLPFDRPDRASGEDFLVSDANRIAVRHLENWREWPLSISVLSGPPLSGRSTLGRHFVAQSGGTMIDDAQGQDEQALFNAWNDAQTARRPLLLIADAPPAQWQVALPDLRSRLAEIETIYAWKVPTLTVAPHLGDLLRQRFGRESRVVPPPLDPLFRPAWRLGPRRRPWIAIPGIFEAEVKGKKVTAKIWPYTKMTATDEKGKKVSAEAAFEEGNIVDVTTSTTIVKGKEVTTKIVVKTFGKK